jgi:hypothetical protein
MTVPDPVRAFLMEAAGRAIIRDPEGNVVGFYATANAKQQPRNGQPVPLIDKRLTGEFQGAPAHHVLGRATEPVQLCDEAGNVFGYFAPVPPDRAEFVARAFPPPDPSRPEKDPLAEFDLEEVERERARNEPGCTLAEVYEHLLAITPEPYWRAHLQERIERLKEQDRCGTP